MYKNIEKQTKLNLKELVKYQEGQVVSKTLVQNDYVSMTIFSFCVQTLCLQHPYIPAAIPA